MNAHMNVYVNHRLRPWTALALLPWLVACGTLLGPPMPEVRDGPPLKPVDVATIPDAVPRVEPLSKYGNPERYSVYGVEYRTLKDSKDYVERGIASWYGSKFHARRTSSGEPYDMYAMTAAHKTLPLPTYAEITNLKTGKKIIVRINDRGPFHSNRIVDLSYAAAIKLGIRGTGLVELRAIDPQLSVAPLIPATQHATHHTPQLFLQAGAFQQRDNADQLRQRLLETAGVEVHITPDAAAAMPLYRVRLGPLATVEEADQLAARLKTMGIVDAHVVVN